MNAWVYLFSKFTPEALLFEALAIFLLFAGYAAFWVLRKRKLGASGEYVPIGVVRSYLNQFIGDAQTLRQQLFGILGGGEIPVGQAPRVSMEPVLSAGPSLASPSAPIIQAGNIDQALVAKISILEAQLAERAKVAETLRIEKENLAKQLANQPTAMPAFNGDQAEGGASSEQMDDLNKKIKLLEDKLNEYSIIEDDLANLKRLQQENKELKEKLAAMGSGAPVAAVAAAAAPVAIESSPPEAALPETAAPETATQETATPEAATLEAAPVEAAPPVMSAEPVQDLSAFENLVTEVEQSMAPEAVPESTPAAAPPAAVSSDDSDLVAEFEKMLNS